MASKNVSKLEARTRVVFNLPVNSTGETKALYEVIGHAQALKDRRVGVTGFTFSEIMPTVFTGFWWSDDQSVWMEDGIVIMMVDFATPSPNAVFATREAPRQTILKFIVVRKRPRSPLSVMEAAPQDGVERSQTLT